MKHCTQCGAKNPRNYKFCTACGTQIGSEINEKEKIMPAEPRAQRRIWPWIILILFVGGLAFGSFLFLDEVTRGSSIIGNAIRTVQQPAVYPTSNTNSIVEQPNAQEVTKSEDTQINLNGKVVFVSNGNIQVLNLETNEIRKLTNDFSYQDANPSWSPDGRKIVFVRTPQEVSGGSISSHVIETEIYVMNSDGSNLVRLTYNDGADSFPRWSPDGTKIVFSSNMDQSVEIYVMNPDGSDVRRLTNNFKYDSAPDWSPDGSKIVFHSGRDGPEMEIYVMNKDGSNQMRLTNHPARDDNPKWSPDGRHIAFTHWDGDTNRDGDYEVYIMDSNGENIRQLTNNDKADMNLAWSPDGTKILFRSFKINGEDGVYVMDTRGNVLGKIMGINARGYYDFDWVN